VETIDGATTTVERCASDGEALMDASRSTTVVDESSLPKTNGHGRRKLLDMVQKERRRCRK